MARKTRAGALGGAAAGLWLLCANAALAAQPAANPLSLSDLSTSDSGSGGLRVIGGDGTLTPMGNARLTPLTGVTVVRLPAYVGHATWNPGDPLTCLAQAVYFEARSESLEGQEAVAQVVMNRTRRPQYAPTVCGVVYQGAERTTGCQFTFTCDGSLREPSDMSAWDRAVEVAKRALAGFIYKPMIEATHYHAAWNPARLNRTRCR